MKSTSAANQGKWRQVVREQEQSGLSIGEFCRKQGYALHQFRYWKDRLRKLGPELEFVPAIAKGAGQPSKDSTGLTLEVGKARIVIRSGFDRELLRQAVRALGGDE